MARTGVRWQTSWRGRKVIRVTTDPLSNILAGFVFRLFAASERNRKSNMLNRVLFLNLAWRRAE
jgi:hypothetical protein